MLDSFHANSQDIPINHLSGPNLTDKPILIAYSGFIFSYALFQFFASHAIQTYRPLRFLNRKLTEAISFQRLSHL